MNRTVQLLNGWWDYRIGDGAFYKKQIPYSDLAVGISECRLHFDAAQPIAGNKRAFLIFEGITYMAKVILNGRILGEMRPYCRYTYEITDLLRPKDNDLRVEIADISVVFGPSEGWENYSGIIRDVSIEYTAGSIICDAAWSARLTQQYRHADCSVEMKIESRDPSLTVGLSLTDPFGNIVAEKKAPAETDTQLAFSIENPLLWSPKNPHLYTLRLTLYTNGNPCDQTVQRVGFKEFKTAGKRFYLNGEPLFLIGVCRHDLFGDQGHIQTEQQMRMDMQMIKDAGANYVRLVHYPHHKRILELADELGLLVSEEPGLWWSDMKNPEIVDGSLEVLRRTIMRDRNHVCVAFWLSFNECMFTPAFLKASAALCRKIDPDRMVSGANCMDIPMTKKHFKACDLDFYTMHPYSPTPERMLESAAELNDKPLLLTEWGGYHVYENPHLFATFIEEMLRTWRNTEDQPVIAGAAVWCWAEVFEFNRAAPACHDGVLNEGLVDRYRNPKANLAVFKKAYAQLEQPSIRQQSLQIVGYIAGPGTYKPVDLRATSNDRRQKQAWDRMLRHALEPIPRFVFVERKQRVLHTGPVLPQEVKSIGSLPVELLRQPIVLNHDTPAELTLSDDCASIYLIGNVSMPKGFPIGGAFGEPVAVCALHYTDGSTEQTVLRNGQEITTAAGWYGPSRVNPVASNAPRALRFVNDMDREHYVVNLFRLPVSVGKIPKKLQMQVLNDTYDLLLYGVTLHIR